MNPYSCRTLPQLESEYRKVLKKFSDCKSKNLNLNMARGKPSAEQLDLVSDILTVLSRPEDC